MIVNGENLVMGRLASFVAKKALEGETVDVVNAEKIIISGSKVTVFKKYKALSEKGNAYHGVFLPKMPDRFVRRAIRGMLPYKKERGMNAYRRIKCHIGVPLSFKDKKMETLEKANVQKFTTMQFVKVKDLCDKLGGKI